MDSSSKTKPRDSIMNLFRRSLSTSSSRSASTSQSTLNDVTPRTSFDSDFSCSLGDTVTTVTPASKAPLNTLPVELLQHIISYLDAPSAATFCLSSRAVCYATGTQHLLKCLNASRSRFERRRTIEAVVERAFPGHWFCAWCDKFHAWNQQTGPIETSLEEKRDCADFNSFLSDGSDYVLRYHHIRLAVNHAVWGAEHGLPLSSFRYSRPSTVRVFKSNIPARLECEARVVRGQFLLHSAYAIDVPARYTSNKHLLKHIWTALPHILSGHRDSDNGHTGLMAAIDNVLRRGWKYSFTQSCCTCATDWTVASYDLPGAPGSQVRLVIHTWRDIGAGRNPFETGWRAHGIHVQSSSLVPTEMIRLTQAQSGEVRRAFENCAQAVAERKEREKRKRSAERSRMYRVFVNRDSLDSSGDEARRSRAPRPWRGRSEIHEDSRGAQGRFTLARDVARSLVGMDMQRGGGK